MQRILCTTFIATSLLAFQPLPRAATGSSRDSVNALKQQGYSVKWVAPIFGQLVMGASPPGFVPTFEKTSGNHYTRESVLRNETVERWTQMLTVTGDRGLASNANLTPKKFAEMNAAQWQNACPNSFSMQSLGERKIESNDGFIVILSCGTSPSTAGQTSESALIVIIKGETDYYTLQWAERSKKSDSPLIITTEKWVERYKQLSPIKLCPIIGGEVEPYPSCVDKK
jgi:hypothetical protein